MNNKVALVLLPPVRLDIQTWELIVAVFMMIIGILVLVGLIYITIPAPALAQNRLPRSADTNFEVSNSFFMAPSPVSTTRSSSPTFCFRNGSVLLYMIFFIALFLLIFSSLLSFLTRNVDFTTKNITLNKLFTDNMSAAEKSIGLFMSNPRNPLIGVDSQKRTIEYPAYVPSMKGYVYAGKTDTIIIDNNKYISGKLPPDGIQISNEGNNILSVLIRKINSSNNQVTNSTMFSIAPTTNIAAYNCSVSSCTPNPSPYDLLVTTDLAGNPSPRYEISLISDTETLYTISAQNKNVTKQSYIFNKDAFSVNITSYERSKSRGIGSKLTMDTPAKLEDDSVNLSSQNDFKDDLDPLALVSSYNEPGVSSAFIDTFATDTGAGLDWIANDATKLGTTTVNQVTLQNGATYTLKRTIAGDFDLRVKFDKKDTMGGELGGIFVKNATDEYRLGVGKTNVYKHKDASGIDNATCVLDTANQQTHSLYKNTPTSPKYVRRTEGACISAPVTPPAPANPPPPYIAKHYPYDTSNKFILRIERIGDTLRASYCVADLTSNTDIDNCDNLGVSANWRTLNDDLPQTLTGDVTVGLYNDDTSNLVAKNFHITKLNGLVSSSVRDVTNPFVYTKTILFGNRVTVTKIQVDGDIQQEATDNYCKNNISDVTDDRCLSASYDHIFQMEIKNGDGASFATTNDQIYIPSGLTGQDHITLNISLKSATGDVHIFPFIRRIRVYYNQSSTVGAGGGGCVDTSWGPDPGTTCTGTSFTQTSNCGTNRTAVGTKDCAECGSANGQISATAPTSGLCQRGNPSAVTNSGASWIWTCTQGGNTANCSAPKSTPTACALSGYAWNPVAGYIAMQSGGAGPGVKIDSSRTKLTGSAWSPEFGYLSMDAGSSSPGVHISSGKLGGYAWNSVIGYVGMDAVGANPGVQISNGKLTGYAWNPVIGYIKFDGPTFGVTYDTSCF
ncbi:MAG: hypothetical protein HQK59_02590 [Deltaproteobacteria bacterium]|nr:hypothetical protein [Deltaproteobacteria bacterium]